MASRDFQKLVAICTLNEVDIIFLSFALIDYCLCLSLCLYSPTTQHLNPRPWKTQLDGGAREGSVCADVLGHCIALASWKRLRFTPRLFWYAKHPYPQHPCPCQHRLWNGAEWNCLRVGVKMTPTQRQFHSMTPTRRQFHSAPFHNRCCAGRSCHSR